MTVPGHQTPADGRLSERSPGEILVEARERAGLSQEQVAKELYVTINKIRALESDEYARLHSDTFTRGYLRAYASLVKVDVTSILKAYDIQAQRLGLVREYVARQPSASNKILWQFFCSIVAVFIVLWLISIWFFNNKKALRYELSPASISPLVDSPSIVGDEVNPAFSGTMSPSAASNKEATQQPSSLDNGGTANGQAPNINAKFDEIEFVFNDECWLEVSDAQGDVLAAELQLAGSRLQVKGTAPFDVKLGNAPAVEIRLNGKKVAVMPALETDVLNLKVSE